nr:helicase-associated domain-containing protein [Renibacterium salmoninarum]
MGITGSGALTDFGAQLLQDGAAAEALLARASPKPVSTVLLQADLTAIAPGFLEPSLADELTLLAEREGHGPTVTFRFSAASIRNALDAGRGPEQILTFLRQHSSTELPQPLEYLIRDTAARHGLLRVASVSSVVSAADETLLLA